MPLLGPDGELLETPVDVELTMPAGGSLKLHFGAAGGTLHVDDEARVRFPEGEWIIVPTGIWLNTLNRALLAPERADNAATNRAARRRPARRN